MGTRSTTTLISEWNNQPLLTLYSQYDGYWSGHGEELKRFLSEFRMVNGLSLNQHGRVANGMGCLAAQLVAHFKDGPGSYYINSPDSKEYYHYEIRGKEGQEPHLTAYVGNEKRFEGPISDFDPNREDDDED